MSGHPVPDVVYLDTSVVAAAIIPGIIHSTACAAFCADLVAAGSEVVFSQILWLELSQVVVRLPADPQIPDPVRRAYQLHRWDQRVEIRRRWLLDGIRRFESLINQFSIVTEIAFDHTIWRASLDVMADQRLRSHDAIHVATARFAGVPEFATIDDDFRWVTDLTIRLLRDAAP